jgi:hypothetical protein
MNGKFEDQLAQLAFGDITGAEAARIEAQAAKDPQARRMLATYRSLKGGLGDLADVPDDQLSKDRLRHAILMSGLKPKADEKASPWGWLWMPATGALVAAGLMMFNGQRGAGEPMVALGNLEAGADRVALNAPTFEFASSGYTPKLEVKKTVASNVQKPKTRRANTPPQELATVELVDFGSSHNYKTDLMVSIDKESRLPTQSVEEPEMNEPSSASSNIVIIENNRDESTGAYRATEVGTASNVLIGG